MSTVVMIICFIFIDDDANQQTEMVAYLTFEKEDLAVEVERYKEDLRG